ncbi:hypothetical protein D0962_18525 [Leptolyngbyaceae cyanobacterium CCMR0082]|uniref:Uncharacterized protein n=1 Tax=Adonisia turfae CCMR0082 TaxID=2304604 RepID=A0A6M0S8E6_9CYAN|nr:hypothetical protein [Adonisia turfae]NEZ64758.1 hypothetical protein [Adonisia turfae CCMR0082]
MPFRAPKVISALKRFFSEKNAVAGVSDAFLIVTVINSVMMVTGLDTPKEGRFAYVHLLLRLGILTGIWFVFYFSYTITSTKEFFRDLQAGIGRYIRHNVYDAIAITYTSLVVLLCVAGSTGLFPLHGGRVLYQGLLLLFPAVCMGILVTKVLGKKDEPKT